MRRAVAAPQGETAILAPGQHISEGGEKTTRNKKKKIRHGTTRYNARRSCMHHVERDFFVMESPSPTCVNEHSQEAFSLERNILA